MQSDNIRLFQNLLHATVFCFRQHFKIFTSHDITVKNIHPKSPVSNVSDISADSPQPNYPHCFTPDLWSYKRHRVPLMVLATTHKFISLKQVFSAGKNKRKRMFCYRFSGDSRSICDNNPMPFGIQNIYIVKTDSIVGNYFKFYSGRINHLFVNFVSDGCNNRPVFCKNVPKFPAVQSAVPIIDVHTKTLLSQNLRSNLGYFDCYINFTHIKYLWP